MTRWIVGGAVLAGAIGLVYVTLPKPKPPAPVAQAPAQEPVAKPAPTAPEPVPPAPVVDVTDIDPLLDPPAIPRADGAPAAGPTLIAVGFEDAQPTEAEPAAPVTPIPPATD